MRTAVTISVCASAILMMAVGASANSIASSTMHFEGALTPQGGGVYTGTVPMTAGEYYVPGGPGEGIATGGGFDVYALTGGCAYVAGYYGAGAWNCAGTDTYLIDYYPASPHDGYPTPGGPWGGWYDPDCADWSQYSLELSAGHWYLRYTTTGESPMSGQMRWGTKFAEESDLGTQAGGHGGSAAHGGGAQAWDWDCGWGVEVIPLELLGFQVTVTDLGAGQYHVTLTPAAGPVVNTTTGVSYGTIQAAINAASPGDTIQVSAGTYQENLASWKDMEITKSLSLIGAGSGATTVELTEGKTNGVEIRGSNMDVTIEGMTFTRAPGSTYASGFNFRIAETASTFTNLVLRDVESAYGSGRNVFIDGNGIYQSITVENCSFHHSGAWGFSVRGTVQGLTIVDSDFEYNGTSDAGHGIGFDIDMPISIHNISVSGGSFSHNKAKGINLVKTTDATFSGITASNNGGAPGGGFGVSLWEWVSASSGLTFEGCTFNGNTLDGFLFGTEGTTTIDNVTIECCGIQGNGRAGVLLYHNFGGSANNVQIVNSTVIGNGSKGVAVSGMTNVVDAENNWWGTTSGAAIAGMVSGSVDYDPWLYGLPPCGDNILWLNVKDASLYVKPSELVVIDMDTLNLLQMVTGVQAVLNFSSTYFGTGGGDVHVAMGDGPWTEVIYSMWDTGGDLDVAIGVALETLGGTDEDLTTSTITLTPTGTEGVTQMVFRPDVSDIDATFFSDTNHQPVWPTKIDSQWIVIDGTNPVVTVTSPNGGENLQGGGSWTITWTATDTNIDDDSVLLKYYDGSAWQTIASGEDNDGSFNWSPVPSINTNTAKVKITVLDLAGNSTSDESDSTFIIDSTNPAVDNITLMAEPGGTTDLTPDGTAIQGDYLVSAYVSDDDTGVDSGIDWSVLPTIVVTDSNGDPLAAGTVQADQANGRFTVVVTVASTTANGTAHISVSGVKDKAGNEAAAGDTFNVNKNQVGGTVSMGTWHSGSAYTFDRDVVFKATDGLGAVLELWTETVSFTNNPGTNVASGSYTLTDVPSGTVNLSAKTAWSLRRRQAVMMDDGQATNNFMLAGGDLNGTNTVNILDYSIMKENWNTHNAVADINGDGTVQGLDYSILKENWFTAGDPQ